MRVMHIITGLSTGGAERALYNLLAGGLTAGFDCLVVSLTDEGVYGERLRALGVPVHALNMRSVASTPTTVARLRRLTRKIRPDVIQGWMDHGNLAASAAGWLAPGRPAVAWNVRRSLHGLENEKFGARQVIRTNKIISRRVDAILYNSRLSRSQHEAFGFANHWAQVIPNGFDLDRLRPDPEKGRAQRQAMGIPAEARVVGHVARFHPMKDHALFLRAAVQVARERGDVRFMLVGSNVGPTNPALAGIVPDDMMDRFSFLGERHDVADLMQAMDIFCQSSWAEAFPNVLGEAMATGLPCVASNVGDSADIVGDTGVVVPPEDERELVNGLLKILSKPGHESRLLGRAARARVEANYALPRVVEQYAGFYDKLTPAATSKVGRSRKDMD